MSFSKIRQQLILIESASKKINVCGARIGALISKNQEIIVTATKFAQARLSSPSIEQYALIPIFKTAKKYTQKICQEYQKRRGTVFSELKKIAGITCLKPKGAFYIIAKLPVNDTKKFCAWLLDDFEYKKQTVMLAPAKDFYATNNKGLQEVRIAYVLNSKDLKKAIAILKIAIEKYNQK